MPQALDELIKKLEATTEGSRELDEVIARCLSRLDYGWWRERAGPSDFTQSLDAALTLKPKGANCCGFDSHSNEVSAYWSRNSVATGHWIVESHHSHSVPIAFCIAALRRRATTGEDNG